MGALGAQKIGGKLPPNPPVATGLAYFFKLAQTGFTADCIRHFHADKKQRFPNILQYQVTCHLSPTVVRCIINLYRRLSFQGSLMIASDCFTLTSGNLIVRMVVKVCFLSIYIKVGCDLSSTHGRSHPMSHAPRRKEFLFGTRKGGVSFN